MKMRPAPLLTLTALLASFAAPLSAQTEAEAAAINYQLALDTCLWNYHDGASFVAAFEQAGFQTEPYLDAGTFVAEAFGVIAFLAPEDFNNTCTVQSSLVPQQLGRQIMQSVAAARFGDTVEQGHPEGGVTECPMLTIFAPRRMMIVEASSAGNAGGCDDPNSSGVVVR